MSSYNYPIDMSWSTDEIIQVVHLYEKIEQGFEQGVPYKELKESYNDFKRIVPSKAEEKTLFKAFEKESSYEAWALLKQLKNANESDILKP